MHGWVLRLHCRAQPFDTLRMRPAQPALHALPAGLVCARQDIPPCGTPSCLHVPSPQVAAASRRILALQQLLGGGDVDVVWMLVREPRLLSADFRR